MDAGVVALERKALESTRVPIKVLVAVVTTIVLVLGFRVSRGGGGSEGVGKSATSRRIKSRYPSTR